MGLPDFHRVPRVRWYLGISPIPSLDDFAYRTVTVCDGPFQTLRLFTTEETSLLRQTPERPRNPPLAVREGLDTNEVWALARSLAATWAISCLIFFPAATEMFHFAACRSTPPMNSAVGTRP